MFIDSNNDGMNGNFNGEVNNDNVIIRIVITKDNREIFLKL